MIRTTVIAIMVGIGIVSGTGIANAKPVQITSPSVLVWLDTCNDGTPVYIDDETGILYGDQDDNGILDGNDCDWK
jgi:hypothetical protein